VENLVHSSSYVVDDVAISNYSREEARGIHLAGHKIDLVRELYYKYSPIEKIFVDGSQISFVKSLKITLYNELREETD
jgi:hypothetical protein